MNKTTFYAYIRKAPFGGRLTQSQIDGVEQILKTAGMSQVRDKRHLAYILATAFHETGGKMEPVREGFGKNDAASRKVVAHRKYGVPDKETGHVYYGRGYVQLTWKANYDAMQHFTGLPLVAKPDLVLRPDISALILVEGMIRGQTGKGDFTGKCLEDYFNEDADNAVGARAIINGKDKAELIASYHRNFLDALRAAEIGKEVAEADAKADTVPLTTDKTVIGTVTSVLGAGGAGLLTGISNPWAFAAFAVVALGAYLFLTGRISIIKKAGA